MKAGNIILGFFSQQMESVWLKEDSALNKKRVTHSEMITATNLKIVMNVRISKHKATLPKLLDICEVLRRATVIGRKYGFAKMDMSSSTKLQACYFLHVEVVLIPKWVQYKHSELVSLSKT